MTSAVQSPRSSPACEAAAAIPEDSKVRKVEGMISHVLRPYPDADVLIPWALLEVGTEEEHRTTLENLVDKPREFRDYVCRMVELSKPADLSSTMSTEDLEFPDTSPLSPSQRSSFRRQLGRSWDAKQVAEERMPQAEVRAAYLQLAKQYHPDKGGDKDMFMAIHAAYELLRADSVDATTA